MGMNDEAWELLFKKYNLLDRIERDGRVVISADRIREVREPRLMTKFDHKANLPQIFLNNGLSILPITRGRYIISSFEAYKAFEQPETESEKVFAPDYLQSLAPQFLTSEAIALNFAGASGILKDFLEDEKIMPTVNGRMSSGTFEFDIETKTGRSRVEVSNSQIEIDAGYEGIRYLSLFEAKKMDLAEDFLIRQLYYPYRTWKDRTTKEVKPIFLIYSNGLFDLYQYQFENPQNYNSLRLVKRKKYIIATEILLEDIERLLKNTPIVQEPEIPFPQANSMERLINLLQLLGEGALKKQDITEEYAFNERQTNYYTDAGRYLGFIYKSRDTDKNVEFSLTPLARQLLEMGYKERQLLIVRQILKHQVFNQVLKRHLESGEMPDLWTIIEIMKESNLYHVEKDSTYGRRASTVMGWVNWILGLIDG